MSGRRTAPAVLASRAGWHALEAHAFYFVVGLADTERGVFLRLALG